MVALVLPCLLSLTVPQMHLLCTGTSLGLTCTLWLYLILLTYVVVAPMLGVVVCLVEAQLELMVVSLVV